MGLFCLIYKNGYIPLSEYERDISEGGEALGELFEFSLIFPPTKTPFPDS